MGISPGLILSLLALVAVGCAMALGATPHGSAMASRVVFWAFPSFASVALVLNILELRRGRSTRRWIRLALPSVLLLGAMLLLVW